MDKLDQLHVVSDLHLGGIPNHQIFNQGKALAALVDHLATAAPEQRVGLALNGDIVDFLAARDAKYLDAAAAIVKLQAIFDDDNFRMVWDALARFVATPRRLLVLVLGNHDVELALPHVQAHLVARLAGDDDAARGRVRIAMDGTGYACEVGGRRVLAIHGNDADSWNVVDQSKLLAVSKAIKEGQKVPDWEPNAGTRLVVDVMNDIKMRYPFVDLLKPERTTVPAVLLALPEDYSTKVYDAAKISLRYVLDSARRRFDFLGESDGAPREVPDDGRRALALLISETQPAAPAPPKPARSAAEEGAALLELAQQDYERGEHWGRLAGDDDLLGYPSLVRDRVTGKDPREDLREALAKYLAGDTTYLVTTEDDTFRALDAEVGPEVTFVIAGHTHLERRILRKKGNGVYFNSGTWIRLIRIPQKHLATKEAFARFFDILTSGELADLDKEPDLIVQRNTVVSIWREGGEVLGELRHAVLGADGEPQSPPWQPVEGTRYPCAER
jgi:UDP-2,3-diacylglucosamine pyrophosphatase LpxH